MCNSRTKNDKGTIMTDPIGVLITENSVSFVLNGKVHNLTDSHMNFEIIKDVLKAGQYNNLEELVDVNKSIAGKIYGTDLEILEDDTVTFMGYEINRTLSDRLIHQIRNGYDVRSFANFVQNLMNNPSNTSIEELYLFIEKARLPLTPDGHFLAYKVVNEDYTDCHTSTFDNSVGNTLMMPRNQVDDRRDNHCSYGFHFCSYDYISFFGGGTRRLMVVKINPADVVSIPSDYDNTKGRTCRYSVVSEIEEFSAPVLEDSSSEEWDDHEEYNMRIPLERGVYIRENGDHKFISTDGHYVSYGLAEEHGILTELGEKFGIWL